MPNRDPDCAQERISRILGAYPEFAPAVSALLEELLRAQQKHPAWPTDPIHAVNVITEEVGELATDANDFFWQGGSDANRAGMHDEAIQVGAMALRFLLHLNTYTHADRKIR